MNFGGFTMKKWLWLLLGLSPFLYGFLMLLGVYYVFPAGTLTLTMPLCGLLFFVIWGIQANLCKKTLGKTNKAIILMHIPAGAVLLILLVEDVILKTYWTGALATVLHCFFFPAAPIMMFIGLGSSSFITYCITALMMVCCAYMGCNMIRKKV
jgi:hypothetical protein